MSQLGAQANCMLHIHLINCYKNDFPTFLSILPTLRLEDGKHMLNLKEKSTGKTIFKYIEEDKEVNRTRHICAVTCCLDYYDYIFKREVSNHLRNCVDIVCDLIKESNLKDLEIALSVLSKYKKMTITVESSLGNDEMETYMFPLNMINEICSTHFTEESKSLVHSYMGNMNLKLWEYDLKKHDVIKQIVSLPFYDLFCTLSDERFSFYYKMLSHFQF